MVQCGKVINELLASVASRCSSRDTQVGIWKDTTLLVVVEGPTFKRSWRMAIRAARKWAHADYWRLITKLGGYLPERPETHYYATLNRHGALVGPYFVRPIMPSRKAPQ